MFQCNQKENIYVICPASYKTGGTELLHQLVYCLKKNGLNAYITYIDLKPNLNPINEAFNIYIDEYKLLEDVIDNDRNIVIVPELKLHYIEKFSKVKFAVWWLSVDNYLKVYTPKKAFELAGTIGLIYYVKNMYWRFRISKISKKIDYNLAQSYYAIDFLRKNKFKNIEYLSDYIGDIYINQNNYDIKSKENIVLYNPKKGMKFTKKLISNSNDLTWVPLINMTNDEVVQILRKSKVYVDFGNHPGKDRFPREAAISGCCIITSTEGSASYYEDVKIPNEYKYQAVTKNIPLITNKIRECLSNYEECHNDFKTYRDYILSEKDLFNNDVKKVFID